MNAIIKVYKKIMYKKNFSVETIKRFNLMKIKIKFALID